MQPRMDQPDWNHLKAFLETAETGSLSAAARKFGLAQPTLSRQVAAIEKQLGVTLFERVGKSMVLTGTGLSPGARAGHGLGRRGPENDRHRTVAGGRRRGVCVGH